tara:strand:- start:377 stop:754 length:378 start_codon:yes stop_codon:yes gene_type:complete
MIELNENNFFIYAIKHYYNPGSMGIDEFENDIKRIKYVKRLLNRYVNTGESSERLVLNHLVILYNVFDDAATDMLFYKLEPELWSDLKTFLVYLQRMPLETVVSPGIKETDIPINDDLAKILRAL